MWSYCNHMMCTSTECFRSFVCMYVCMYVNKCSSVCLYDCMSASLFVCLFICVFVCVFVSLFNTVRVSLTEYVRHAKITKKLDIFIK